MEKLSKERAIELHREMWRRIARKHEEGELSSTKLKIEVLQEMGYDLNKIRFSCFCCEYTRQLSDGITKECPKCPINWETEITPNSNCCNGYNIGIYGLWIMSKNPEEALKYAKIIAELPEKEDQNGKTIERTND